MGQLLELQSGKVLEERVHIAVRKDKKRHRRAKRLIGSKQRVTGKLKYDEATTMDEAESDDEKDILGEKTHIITKKTWHPKALRDARSSSVSVSRSETERD